MQKENVKFCGRAEAQVAVGDTSKALETLKSALHVNPRSQQAIQFKENINTQIQIREDLTKLHTNPRDNITRQHLTNQVATLEKNSQLNTSQILQIASAKATLGDTATAMNLVDSALKRSPASSRAVKMRNSFETRTTSAVRRQP